MFIHEEYYAKRDEYYLCKTELEKAANEYGLESKEYKVIETKFSRLLYELMQLSDKYQSNQELKKQQPIQPLHRQYNLNTKYGRRKASEQAQYNYDNGGPEYQKEIDQIGGLVWFVIIIFCTLIFLLIWNLDSPEAAIKWLR